MEPITIRLREDELQELSEEAEEQGFSSRSEYIRRILRNRDEHGGNTELNTSEHVFGDRLDDLEQRVDELEAQNTATAQDGSNSPVSDSSPDRMETPHPSEEIDGSGRVGRGEHREGGSTDDELRDRLREWLDENPPKKNHVQEMVLDVFEYLRQNHTAETKELKEHLFPNYREHYSDEVALWNSIDRHLKSFPGVEKAGYGEWAYPGDSAVREQFGEQEAER